MNKIKLILSLVAVLFVFNTAFASNPQIRTCRVNGGQFWAMNIVDPTDSIGFCRLNSATVGTLSLMKLVHNGELTHATYAFKMSKVQRVDSCKTAGATLKIAQDSNGAKTLICMFEDYSFIAFNTLVKGWNSPDNSKLTNLIIKNLSK